MRMILALLFILFTGVANAGSITVTISSNGNPDVVRAYNIPDADIGRIIAAWQIEANAANNAPANRVFVLRYWIMEQFIRPTIARVKSVERQTAVDAVPEPAPINPQ